MTDSTSRTVVNFANLCSRDQGNSTGAGFAKLNADLVTNHSVGGSIVKVHRILMAALSLSLLSISASGITFSGGSAIPEGTSLVERPELAGTVIAMQTFSFVCDFGTQITVMNWVLRENSTGTLDFYYQFVAPNDHGALVPDFQITGFDTADPNLEVDFRTDLGGSPFFPRISEGGGSLHFIGERAIGNSFPLPPNSRFTPFFVRTDATGYALTGEIEVFGALPDPVTTTAFAPLSSVPEPSSLALLPLAISSLLFYSRRITRNA